MRLASWVRIALAALVPPVLVGCYASNVVAREQRMVDQLELEYRWQPALAEQLLGLWESVEIRGDAAVGLRKIYYLFAEAGRYSGAALTADDGGGSFQTIDGVWSLHPDGLRLDDGDPVAVEAAGSDAMAAVGGRHLRIRSAQGEVTLREVVLQ